MKMLVPLQRIITSGPGRMSYRRFQKVVLLDLMSFGTVVERRGLLARQPRLLYWLLRTMQYLLAGDCSRLLMAVTSGRGCST